MGNVTYYRYRCTKCRFEHEVQDAVVDDMVEMYELPEGKMPKFHCPECGATSEAID